MSKPDKVVPENCIGFALPPKKSQMSYIDAIVYQIGIGYGQDPMNEAELPFVFEMSEEFSVFPTNFSITRGFELFEILVACPGMPNFDPMRLLHGENKVDVLKQIKIDTPYLNVGEIGDVADKGKGALVTVMIKTFEEKDDGTPGDLCIVCSASLFVRGIGGFGYKGKYPQDPIVIPKSEPTKTSSQSTSPNQALIYRLAGDRNPLHVDPNMAALAGFDKPILHGLCTYGISAKQIVQTFAQGDINTLKSIRARFTSHVFPGETLDFAFWVEGNKISFEAKTRERGLVVIVGDCLVNLGPKL